MNLQIIGDKSARKVIALTDDLMGRGPGKAALHVLRRIIGSCGLGDRYLVVPVSRLGAVAGRWAPYALVSAETPPAAQAARFQICVSDRGSADLPEETCHHTTYSLGDDRADFVAKNLRHFQGRGETFDLVGLGIIGRIRLAAGDERTLRATLIAASAALSCGISFADVLEVLNTPAGAAAHSGAAAQ